jgi:hypothetical protein
VRRVKTTWEGRAYDPSWEILVVCMKNEGEIREIPS